jgi:hypothetical protein
LRDYQFQWPAFDLALAAAAMRWAMLALIAGGAAWLMWRLARWATRVATPPAVSGIAGADTDP